MTDIAGMGFATAVMVLKQVPHLKRTDTGKDKQRRPSGEMDFVIIRGRVAYNGEGNKMVNQEYKSESVFVITGMEQTG